MNNKKVRQMMVDVEKHLSNKAGNTFDERLFITWFDGPCLVSGANFMWLCEGVVSLTAEQLRNK
ncbi:putative TMhelix containing protein [Vibrio phage 191E37-1]|nr:putative TMhelix containing protein [Vibrio phage 191E37-1]